MFSMKRAKSSFLLFSRELVFLIDATKVRGWASSVYKSCDWEYAFQFIDSVGEKEK